MEKKHLVGMSVKEYFTNLKKQIRLVKRFMMVTCSLSSHSNKNVLYCCYQCPNIYPHHGFLQLCSMHYPNNSLNLLIKYVSKTCYAEYLNSYQVNPSQSWPFTHKFESLFSYRCTALCWFSRGCVVTSLMSMSVNDS